MIYIKNLIINYLNNLDASTINDYFVKNNIILSQSELDYIMTFIKKDGNNFLNNPHIFNIDQYQNHFSKENFIKIKNLYKEALIKYCLEHSGEEVYGFLRQLFDDSMSYTDSRAFVIDWLNHGYSVGK